MKVWLLCFAFSIFVFTAPATLPLRQGEYPQGEGVDTWFAFAVFLSAHSYPPPPLRSSRLSQGDSLLARCAFLLPVVTNSPPETGASTP